MGRVRTQRVIEEYISITTELEKAKFEVVLRAFIPDEYAESPGQEYIPDLIDRKAFFTGDNRQYYDANAKSSRAEQKIKIDFETGKVYQLNNTASASHAYDSSMKFLESSKDVKAGSMSLLKSFRKNSKSVNIGFSIAASNLLVAIAPDLDIKVFLEIKPYLTEEDMIEYTYKYYTELDGFPAYEMFIINLNNNRKEANLVFNQNPIDRGNQGLEALVGTGEFHYKIEGDSSVASTFTRKSNKVLFSEIENVPEY